MNPSHVERSVLTDAILSALAATLKPVGDAEAPRGGIAGWQGGQPNATGTNFVPYSVLTPLNASGATGPLSDSQGDWVLPYALTCYGVSRKQCEWMADTARNAIMSLNGQTVTMDSGTSNAYDRYIQQVIAQQIGAVQKVTETDPPYYGQSDVVALWTSR